MEVARTDVVFLKIGSETNGDEVEEEKTDENRAERRFEKVIQLGIYSRLGIIK